MAVHLSAEVFGLTPGDGGAGCGGYVDGDAISGRRTDEVTCLACWRAYGADRAVRLAALRVQLDQHAEARQGV